MKHRSIALLLLFVSIFLGACAGVLGLRKRDQGRPFEHNAHVMKGIGCLTCHDGVQNAGDDDPLHIPGPAKCLTCHSKPHDARACDMCHGESYKRIEAAAARKHLRFEHKKHLNSYQTGDLKGQCVPCHARAGESDDTSLRPPMAQCFKCHEHEKQFEVKNCNGCHHDLISEHVRPATHVPHDGDFLREHGVRAASSRELCSTCHNETFCTSCHGVTTPALPWRLEIEKPKLNKLHAGGWIARHPMEARAQTGLCTTCHAESFCQSCHESKMVAATSSGAKNPHPPGWVRAVGGEHGRAARLDPGSCASCHGGAGEKLCVGCHKVGGPGGNPHGSNFSSKRDKLKDQPCTQCHAP